MKILALLGYMTAAEAKGHGFTHHGSYYGMPLWLAPGAPGIQVAATAERRSATRGRLTTTCRRR
jgi:hypothetical protein